MGRGKRFIVLGIMFILFAGIIILVILKCNSERITDREQHSEMISEDVSDGNHEEAEVHIPEEYIVELPDAEVYYEQNSKVITTTKADESEQVMTESEVCALLSERGFSQFSIKGLYTMDGAFCETEEINDKSTTKHPMYETYYVTAYGELWTIFVINGAIMANPVSYNLQSDSEVDVIISEGENVTSYDNITNCFFETLPNSSELLVLPIAQISAASLDVLSIEEVNKYVH